MADDASPDARIPALLASFAARDPRVTVVRREQNLGFVRNCNRAMAEAAGDVVLLNSDTEVPAGWLERLRALAHSSDRVGSVTPLSNNATICSVPEWLVPNRYPAGVDLALLDEAAQASGTGEWLEIPTSVGFCVYYRREALDACGPFDEDLFGAGYGEENDLACRMREAGYLNLLCDTLFVWHEGGVSFAESGTGDLAGNLDRITAALAPLPRGDPRLHPEQPAVGGAGPFRPRTASPHQVAGAPPGAVPGAPPAVGGDHRGHRTAPRRSHHGPGRPHRPGGAQLRRHRPGDRAVAARR